MSLSGKLIAATVGLAILFGLLQLYVSSEKTAAVLEEREAQASAHQKWLKEFEKEKAAGAARVAKAEALVHETRRQSDEKIAELVRRDEAVRDWYEHHVPGVLVDVIWVRDSGPISVVPGGYELGARFDVTGKAYAKTREW